MMKINGKQIRPGQINDQHINGKLTEAVLDINYASHATEILDTKMIVDMVQQNNISIVKDAAQFSFLTDAEPSNSSSDKGVVLNEYEVQIRNKDTGEPVLFTGNGATDAPIYGVITSGVQGSPSYQYTVDLKAKLEDGTVVNASMLESTTIDITYPRRFSLADVHETFAANEKFVDAAADVTAHLNIKQLAKEIFGVDYVLTNIGDLVDPFGNGKSMAKHFADETHGAVNTDVSASTMIDEVVAARGDTAKTLSERLGEIVTKIGEDIGNLKSDLSSSGVDKGTHMIRLDDNSDIISALGETTLSTNNRTVHDALDALYNLHDALNTKNINLTDALAAEVKSREDGDTAITNTLNGVIEEVTNARGSAESIDGRLDISLNADGTFKDFQRMHKHHYYHKTVTGGATKVSFTFPGGNQFDKPKTDDHYIVKINGIQQEKTGVYTVTIENTNDVVLTFVDPLYQDDSIMLEAAIHAVSQI